MAIQIILTTKNDLLTDELHEVISPAIERIMHLLSDVKITQTKELI